MSTVNWKDPATLQNLTPTQALMILGEVCAVLDGKQAIETKDAEDPRLVALSASEEAQQFADAARAFHRRGIAAHDCRPQLRVQSEERRAQVTDAQKSPEQLASEYAATCREHHRR